MVGEILSARRLKRIVAFAVVQLLVVISCGLATSVPLPVQGDVTQGFHANHNGIDIAAPIGTPIYNIEEGEITVAGGNDPRGFGSYVEVLGKSGHRHIYGHVNAFHVSIGQWVRAGDHIADVGNRGQSSGPHVHWRVTTPQGNGMDPLAFEMPPEPEPTPEHDHPVPPVVVPPAPGELAAQILAMLQAAWQEIQRHLPQVMPVG